MRIQHTPLLERCRAVFTLKGLFIAVNSLMLLQMAVRNEALITMGAFERFLTTVLQLVSP